MKNLTNTAPIVCIGFPTWEGDYQKSTVLLMSELSRHRKVLYVEYPRTWKDWIQGVMGKKRIPWRRMLGLKSRVWTSQQDNGGQVEVMVLPPVLPTHWINSHKTYARVNGWQSRILAWSIRRAMKRLGMQGAEGINAFNPYYGVGLLNRLPVSSWSYYCYDEISAAHWCRKHGPHMEAKLVPQVDRVIVSSTQLKRRFDKIHPHVHWVPNGVRHGHFEQALAHPSAATPFTFGYLGSIDDRMDLELMEKAFASQPYNRFLFVGPVRIPGLKERWARYDHVELVGPQPPEELPRWVAEFNVALIPFVKNEFTAAIYPMKINEYLAAGRPVITTKFTDFRDFPVGVKVAQGWLDFTLLMDRFERGKLPIEAKVYSQWSAKNSWEHRGESFSQALVG